MKISENKRRRTARLLSLALPALVLVAGLLAAFMVFQSKPTASRAPARERQARLVTVTAAEAAPATLTLSANGTVEAADSTELRARVSGQIVALADKLAPGTRFAQAEVLARIDPSDYQLALTRAQTDLANARAALRVEQGQQAVAKRELSLVGSDVSADERDLALRGPQLEQAKAEVEAARTAVKQAQLDLDRTAVRAPFAGIVTARSASLGDVVTTSDTLATLASTDVYWVDVSLPVDQLRWLQTRHGDEAGSPARIYYPDAWGRGVSMDAQLLRIQPGLETDGRMARVLLRVPDPLGGNAPGSGSNGARLLLGAYVEAGIQADIPAGSVIVDAAFVHENNEIWVMRDNDTLDIRSVNIAYRDSTRAVIAGGLEAGDAVITSELTAPIQDMPIRVESPMAAAGTPATRDGERAAHDDATQAAGRDAAVDRNLHLRLSGPAALDAGAARARATRQASTGAAGGPRS